MAEENSFKFACPHCLQHVEADADMVGMTVDCPVCGQSFEVPRIEATRTAAPVITVIRKRERFVDRCKKRIVIGVGTIVLLLAICIYKASNNRAETRYNLGMRYYNGEGVTQDKTEAVRFLRKAAEHGHVKAEAALGRIYRDGDGVPQDKTESVNWFRKAAENGSVEAQAALGLCYFHGEGVVKNEAEAMKWFLRAAEHGHAESQCLLGLGFESGIGVAKDMHEAMRWLRRAGEQGQVKAQSELAAIYFLGRGVERDYKQSMKWCSMAAEQGDPEAQYMFGSFYRNGLGVTMDKEEAVKWFRKAATQGYAKAQKTLDELCLSRQRTDEKPTKEFGGQIDCINNDCTIVIRDFTKSGIYFGVRRKVRLDGIKIKRNDSAKEFLRRRGFGEVLVTYKELDSDGCVKGTIWDGAYNGQKSLNDILVEERYAEYDNR